MTEYQIASKKQKTIAFIIDMGIVCLLGFLISFFILKFTNVTNHIREIGAQYQKALAEEMDSTELFKEYLFYKGISFGTYSLVYFIIILIYFVFVPWKTEFQTLGRLVSKTKVVTRKVNTNPSLKALLVREIVGLWLLYFVLTILLGSISKTIIFLNLFFWFSELKGFMSGGSYLDRMSNLKLISLDPEDQISFEAEEYLYPEDYDYESQENVGE